MSENLGEGMTGGADVAAARVHERVEGLRSVGAPSPATGPLVSVLIVSHECVNELTACLSSLSLERQTIPLEVIVVDNASRDGTVAEISRRFPWVRMIANRKNTGFAHASNQAMGLAVGEFLLLLNPDTVVPRGGISAALAALESHDDVGMLTCKLVRPDGSFDHACKRGFPTVTSALYYFVGLSQLMPHSARFAQYTAGHLGVDDTGLVDAVSGAFMLVRRSAVDAVGALDERYWLYAEDLDWCRRFWERGWKILYWPGVEITHVKGASAGDHRSLRLNYAFHRSFWLFYAKHHAPQRSPFLSVLVWLGIWAKFSASVVLNAFRKAARLAPRTRPERVGFRRDGAAH
jgi:GT2 family glycosyltransferase